MTMSGKVPLREVTNASISLEPTGEKRNAEDNHDVVTYEVLEEALSYLDKGKVQC